MIAVAGDVLRDEPIRYTCCVSRDLAPVADSGQGRQGLKIKFYGRLGDSIGREIDFDPPDGTDTIAKLRSALAAVYPDAAQELRDRSHAIIADSIVGESHKLAGPEMVEFFPPLSGG